MLERPGQLYAMRSEGYWLDIGTPTKYLEAQMDVLEGKVGLPPTPTATEREPGVWIERGASIASDATLVAPVLIGSGSTVEPGARVSSSVVGPRASIGAGAVVLDSVVLADTAVPAGAVLDGVVLGPDARLDGKAEA